MIQIFVVYKHLIEELWIENKSEENDYFHHGRFFLVWNMEQSVYKSWKCCKKYLKFSVTKMLRISFAIWVTDWSLTELATKNGTLLLKCSQIRLPYYHSIIIVCHENIWYYNRWKMWELSGFKAHNWLKDSQKWSWTELETDLVWLVLVFLLSMLLEISQMIL